MEAYLNRSIKEVIKEFPPVEKILDDYGIGCGPCAVGPSRGARSREAKGQVTS